jgi:hypothetical protein
MALTVEKVVHLSDTRAQRLERLAVKQGTSENALVEKALDILFDLSESEDAERRAWSAMSLNSLARVWNNDADAVYDNWRELYGVPER